MSAHLDLVGFCPSIEFITRHQPKDVRHPDIVHVSQMINGVVGDATPVESSDIAGLIQRLGQTDRREVPLVAQLLEHDAAHELVEHGCPPHLLLGEVFGTDSRHPYRIRLCRRKLFFRYRTGRRHGLFDDVRNRLPGGAI